MVGLRRYIYVHFSKLDVLVEASDVSAAKQRIKETYPSAVFSGWQKVGEVSIIVAWASVRRQLRNLESEDSVAGEPDAFVICQPAPIAEE